MTSTEDQQNEDQQSSDGQHSGGGLAGVLKDNPVVSRLGDAAKDYAKARGSDAVRKVAGRVGGLTESLNDKGDSGGFKGAAMSGALQRIGEGDSPVKAALGGVGTGIKEKVRAPSGAAVAARSS